MKTTPFHQMHIQAGAKMGEFAGFDMPLFYPLGVMAEHKHTREKAGLFDISHMVHIEIKGPHAAETVESLCPYAASSQTIGAAKYTFFLNEDAGIIDDLIVTRLDGDKFLIVANAGCAQKDIAHVESVAEEMDCEIAMIPRAFLALQGPAAESVLEEHGFKVADMAFMTGVGPGSGWFLSRTGYTGEDGFEIGLPEDEAVEFASRILSDDRVEWIGLGARDSLRLEAGLPLYGQDLDEHTTPHEAGLLWAIAKELRHGGDFIGAASLGRKIDEGRKRMRVALLPDGRPVRGGTRLANEDGDTVGSVTSGGFGPTFGGPIALGMVDAASADEPLFADLRGKMITMKRTKTPFVPHAYKR